MAAMASPDREATPRVLGRPAFVPESFKGLPGDDDVASADLL